MIGILALQGDVREHEHAFADLGAATRRVRGPGDLRGVDGIVLPGGESTTLSLLMESSTLLTPIGADLRAGLPVFGTCAGLVLLAARVEDGRADQRTFGIMDCTVRRNGYGRQRFSFTAALDPSGPEGSVAGLEGGPLPAVFIRAPRVLAVGPGVEVLARLVPASGGAGLGDPGLGEGAAGLGEGDPVLCREGSALASSFHPELTGDRRVHRLFLEMAGSARLIEERPGRLEPLQHRSPGAGH